MDNLSLGAESPLVLIADDEPAIRLLLQRALARDGLRSVLAANGREAIEMLAEHDIDVALLDLNMPILNGLAALREIRADARYRTLPVILITGSDSESARVRGTDGTADDYLAKPVSLDELRARVRAQLTRRSG